MRPERRNGGARICHPRTIDTRGSASRLTRCGARQADATLDSQFQKDELAEATEAPRGRPVPRLSRRRGYCGFGIWGLGFPEVGDPASGAKKDRAQKRERTSHNYIVH